MNALDHSATPTRSPDTDTDANSSTRPMVTGLFKDREGAESAYSAVIRRGYNHNDIHLVMSDETRKKHFSNADSVETDLGNKAAKGAGIGGVIGGGVGAIAAAVVAVGTSLLIPGLGIIIAGPAAAALAGAGAGGLTGGLVGALVGWRIPEARLKAYEEDIKNGGILMGISPRSDDDAAHFGREWNTGVSERHDR